MKIVNDYGTPITEEDINALSVARTAIIARFTWAKASPNDGGDYWDEVYDRLGEVIAVARQQLRPKTCPECKQVILHEHQ